MSKKSVPQSLRIWFLIHFAVDIIFGIPLLLFPKIFLDLLGILTVETITARLVGAALLGIGGVSIFSHKREGYNSLLTLKIIWSICAIIGLLISLFFGAPKIILLIVLLFAIFSISWIYHKRKL